MFVGKFTQVIGTLSRLFFIFLDASGIIKSKGKLDHTIVYNIIQLEK